MPNNNPHIDKAFKLLALSCFLIFLGRGYQLLWWDAPWRVILWDQKLLEPVVTGIFHTTWKDYATNLSINYFIRNASFAIGVLMIISAFLSLRIIHFRKRWMCFIIYASSLFLFINIFLETKEQFYHWGYLLENSIQILSPIGLILYLKNKINQKQLLFLLKILIALTFFGHGLYALGYYPVPGNYIDMTINILGITEVQAVSLLKIVGYIDILLVPFILFKPAFKWIIGYAILWGLVTAFARTIAGFNSNFVVTTLHQSCYQTIFRLAHGLVPLVVLWLYPKTYSK